MRAQVAAGHDHEVPQTSRVETHRGARSEAAVRKAARTDDRSTRRRRRRRGTSAVAVAIWMTAGCSSTPRTAITASTPMTTAATPTTTATTPTTSAATPTTTAVIGTTSATVPASPSLTPLPDSMAVIGHSGATGYNSDPANPSRDATENSWATGTNPDVDSVYLHVLAINPAISGHNVNLARDGSDVQSLITQAQAAVQLDPQPDLVLVQTVDNDMRCDGRDDEFLPTYGARLDQALQVIEDGDPNAKVFVISQPGSVESYTNAVKDNLVAVHSQSGGGPCDVFDRAGNILAAGEASLESVLQRFFAMIASQCARHPNCRFDQARDHQLAIVSADITPDSNHYTVSGQHKVAAAVWDAMTSPDEPAAPSSSTACPNPDGGTRNRCRGDLPPGTYTTTAFEPTLTYTVGGGWSNMEDLPGNFLLIPPGGSLDGVNPMTSDFLGVYTSVVPPLPCVEQAAAPTVTTPQVYVDWLRAQPQLATTEPSTVTIGGLTGLQVDVSLVEDQACSDPAIAEAYGLVILGIGPSQLTHGVVPNYPLRLDLLADGQGVLAVELADAPNGGSRFPDWWTAAEPLLGTFHFTPDQTAITTTSSIALRAVGNDTLLADETANCADTAAAGGDTVATRRPKVMAKYVRVEMIELPMEQLFDDTGVPVEHSRAARHWWAAGRAACVAVAQRAASASESVVVSGAPPGPVRDKATIGFGDTNFRRLIGVPGDQLADVLGAWWLRAAHDDSHLRLQGPQPIVGGWGLPGSLRWRALSRRLPIEVRLTPYAGRWSVLELTPRRLTRPSRRYFRVGHDSLDAFVAGLSSFLASEHLG